MVVFMLAAFLGDGAWGMELPYYTTADFTPRWRDEVPGVETQHRVAEFELWDQNGEIVTQESLRGKVYVANFFFTGCSAVCEKMTRNLKRVAETYVDEERVMFLSHSVTPWVDTQEALKDFEERSGIDGMRWKLARGEKRTIYQLARESYFADELGAQDGEDAFIHSENLLLVDGDGRIRGVYNGILSLDMQRLIEDIGVLLGKD